MTGSKERSSKLIRHPTWVSNRKGAVYDDGFEEVRRLALQRFVPEFVGCFPPEVREGCERSVKIKLKIYKIYFENKSHTILKIKYLAAKIK